MCIVYNKVCLENNSLVIIFEKIGLKLSAAVFGWQKTIVVTMLPLSSSVVKQV